VSDSDGPLGADPLKTARDLTGALEGMTVQLTAVKATVRRSKRVIAALAVSLFLDVCLTIGVTVAAVQSGDASSRAADAVTQLHASNVSACRQANVNRAQDIAIWDKFLAGLAPPAVRTAAVRAELAEVNHLIAVKDAPRNCARLYATSGLAAPAVPR
jgi:hypothetical protein